MWQFLREKYVLSYINMLAETHEYRGLFCSCGVTLPDANVKHGLYGTKAC